MDLRMTPTEAIALIRGKYAQPKAPANKTWRPMNYAAYLKTPAWRERRALVMKRAKNVCEGCGQAKATEVHHLTYAHIGKEFLFELVALCGACHDRWHKQ